MSVLGPFALALVAGMLSFSSPCCLPLMPGYLSYVSGVAGGHVGTVAVRRRVVGSALLFVAGFTGVFTLLGATASFGGGLLLRNRDLLTRGAGAFVIVMGLAAMGVVRARILQRERRFDLHRVRSGPAGALPLGMAFAIGWTPCIGPVLAGILAAAAATQTAAWGALLLFVYSLGLGIPFLLLALGYARAGSVFGWLRRHGPAIERLGGGILVAMGVLMVTGTWIRLFAPLLRWFARSQWPPI